MYATYAYQAYSLFAQGGPGALGDAGVTLRSRLGCQYGCEGIGRPAPDLRRPGERVAQVYALAKKKGFDPASRDRVLYAPSYLSCIECNNCL